MHLTISTDELTNFILEQLKKKDLIDSNDKEVIKGVDINPENNSAVFIMRSINDGKAMQLLDGVKLLGHTLRISTYNEQVVSSDKKEVMGASMALANNAELSAASAAISYLAFQSIVGKNDPNQGIKLGSTSSKI